MNIKNLLKKEQVIDNDNIIYLSNVSDDEKDKLNAKFESCSKILKICFVGVPSLIAVSSFFFGVKLLLIAALALLCIGWCIYDVQTKYNDKPNLIYIKASCFDKKRGGYRWQYKKYLFKYNTDNGEEHVFSILSTNKNQFTVSSSYVFLINTKNTDISEISKRNIITYIQK